MGRKSKAQATKKNVELKLQKPLEPTSKKDHSQRATTEVVLNAQTKQWEIGELLYVKHDYREFVFVEKTDRGIWCRPFGSSSPKNMVHVAFGDILFAQAPLKTA